MTVLNFTKNTVVANDLKEISSVADKFLGLLRQSNPSSLFFKTRFGIHTFFLKDPIDVIVLDQDFKVVKIVEVLPNRLFFWNPKYFYILELPKGTIKNTKTKVGDVLKVIKL